MAMAAEVLERSLPLAPLLAMFEGKADSEVAWACGVTRRTVQRWRNSGQVTLGWVTADKVALHMSMHPIDIWPEEW